MEDIKVPIFKTKDIKSTIQKYAITNHVAYESCDFIIRMVKSYIKTTQFKDFQLFNENINEVYKNKEKIINEHLQLEQIYGIEIQKRTSKSIKLVFSIDFGEFSTHPIITIEPTSIIPYRTNTAQEMFLLLVKELNKIKAMNKIIINVFDETMIKDLKKFTKELYADNFIKDVKILLFEGVEPERHQSGELIMHFKNKPIITEFIEVEIGEILIEFSKPIYGKNGFNAFGKIIECEFYKKNDDLKVIIDTESVSVEEDNFHKIYRSKIKGYVLLTDKKLMVANQVNMTTISRLNTSLANEKEDNNIEVFVSQDDTNKDSVGEGTEITSERVHITGHVGANSIIEALTLQIDGATHKDSFQFARNAIINRHKGTLRCNNAKISLLEGGKVHATNVEIESSLGGEIFAQNVIIGLVKNHLKVDASNSITINLVTGEDNIFKISYRDIPILMSKLELLEEELENLKYSLQEAQRHNKAEILKIEENIENIIQEQNKIINSTKNAKIQINKPMLGSNKIIFVLENGDEILYNTSAQQYEPFYLEYKEKKIILHPINESFPFKKI